MSRKRVTIEVEPPTVFREARPERFTVGGFTCPKCDGNGWVWRMNVDAPDWEQSSCPLCGGSCEVSADVTISWRV